MRKYFNIIAKCLLISVCLIFVFASISCRDGYILVPTTTTVTATQPPRIINQGQTVTVTKTNTVTSTVTDTVTNTVTSTVTNTLTVYSEVPTGSVDGVAVFTYSGKGETSTPPFSIDTSPWVLQYTADWEGLFYVTLEKPLGFGEIVINKATAGEMYTTYVYATGENLYFDVRIAQKKDGNWTLTVIQPN